MRRNERLNLRGRTITQPIHLHEVIISLFTSVLFVRQREGTGLDQWGARCLAKRDRARVHG